MRTSDKQKALALRKMADVTLQRIKDTDVDKYASPILKDYYDVLHELMEAITSLDGIKMSGEGAHEKLINYIVTSHGLEEMDRIFLQELRNFRNMIAYEGFFIEPDYLKRNQGKIDDIIKKLISVLDKRRS